MQLFFEYYLTVSCNFQVVDKVNIITDSGRTRGLSRPGHISSRGRVGYTNMDDFEGVAGTIYSEDCDQPSPVPILEDFFLKLKLHLSIELGWYTW